MLDLSPYSFNKCRKQYVGQTVDTFRYRWKNTYGLSCMQEHLYGHSCDSEHGGFLNEVSITLNYWKHTLKTFAPYSLNIKENV